MLVSRGCFLTPGRPGRRLAEAFAAERASEAAMHRADGVYEALALRAEVLGSDACAFAHTPLAPVRLAEG
jgi:hypothetical protein